MAEEEVMAEVEAVQAVYGDECKVLGAHPPLLHLHLMPRTADVSSQQFVEATIGIQAGTQYPEEPPVIRVIDSKGLDEKRQKHLIDSICSKSLELASCLMLVALCEEAVEKLTSMNHPDGDCPLCLYPLLDEEDSGGNSSRFMKLMSCFHCFHSECIIRWWNYVHLQSEKESSSSSSSTPPRIMQGQQGMDKMMEESTGKCPVCRKVFLTKDIEHVLDLVGTGGNTDSDAIEIDTDILQSESEKIRREKYEAILKIQQENSGLIEPRKTEVLLPGMFLPQSISLPPTESDGSPSEPRNTPPTESDGIPSEPRNKNRAARSDINPGSSCNRPGPRKHNNSNARRHRTQNSSKQARHWIRKESDS